MGPVSWPTVYIAVPGTHGSRRNGDWFDPLSNLSVYLAHFDLENAAGLAMPYTWSTDLDFGDGGHDDWRAAGAALFYYGAAFPTLMATRPANGPKRWGGLTGAKTVIISHSHGRQVVLYAAAMGMKIDRWIDVAGPVVASMDAVDKAARKNIRKHLHLYAGWRDYMQWLGELFDGHLGIVREDARATRNEKMPGGHGNILRDLPLLHLWNDRGWIRFLRDEEA